MLNLLKLKVLPANPAARKLTMLLQERLSKRDLLVEDVVNNKDALDPDVWAQAKWYTKGT
jgi:hypothetical protein